ncbi:hypothetical protein Q1695_008284 [Nippostrongylus brasiliensis]|nr:hypothetical protein Q1695_008284 [Nippostrongylus brasiliensis]
MFILLLSLVILQATEAQQGSPNSTEIIGMINDFRRAIAKGEDTSTPPNPSSLPTTGQMFQLEENEDLDKRALLLTMMCDNVQPPPAPYSYVYYRSRKAVDNTVISSALDYWYLTAENNNMDNNATYTADLKNFAQVIYYKSTVAGCAVAPFTCSGNRPYGFACVFNNQPTIGEPLYPADSTAGCPTTGGNTCPKVDNQPSTCDDGLCVPATGMTFAPNAAATTAPTTVATTASTAASTAAASSATSAAASSATITTTTTTTTTTTPTTTTTAAGVITPEIQATIVLMHNNRRMMAARGTVINGKSGKYLPQGANLNELTYDQYLGSQAQQFAQTCPTSAAATVNNYEYGQNVLIANTVNIPYGDLIQSAIRNWFDEIYVNGMNNKMNFTDFLATKPNPPTHFTQMVWANHRTVGCGAHRCGSNTVVVCRYAPGGNIIGQYVYQVGAPCSACNFGCNTQFSLCIVPTRS